MTLEVEVDYLLNGFGPVKTAIVFSKGLVHQHFHLTIYSDFMVGLTSWEDLFAKKKGEAGYARTA